MAVGCTSVNTLASPPHNRFVTGRLPSPGLAAWFFQTDWEFLSRTPPPPGEIGKNHQSDPVLKAPEIILAFFHVCGEISLGFQSAQPSGGGAGIAVSDHRGGVVESGRLLLPPAFDTPNHGERVVDMG